MAALMFCLFSVGQDLFHIGRIFYNTGFSISKCIVYIKQIRRQRLFTRYLNELKLNSDSDNNCATNMLTMDKNKMNRISSSSFENDEEIEIIEGFEIDNIPPDTTFYDFIDPHIVYSNNNLGEIKEGVSFMITGTILPNCERFSINFILGTPNKDIALHVNPRLPQNYIVRNCKVKGIWGIEEVTSVSPCCLERGKNFSIQILITNTDFLISVNGKHFTSFRHKLPFTKITCLEIKGDVDNINVDRNIVTSYPELSSDNLPKIISLPKEGESTLNCYKEPFPLNEWNSKIIHGVNEPSMDMPFYGILKDKLILGKSLRIYGRVKVLPHSFYINLQRGHLVWPHPIIAFHFNPRFANIGGKHVICRNSWYNNKWDQEERTEIKTDFMPGKSFLLHIYCSETGYEVYLNKHLLTEYKFRLEPEIVDTVYIQGDIKLWNVILQEGKPIIPVKQDVPKNTSFHSNEEENNSVNM